MAGRLYRGAQIRRTAPHVPALTVCARLGGVPLYGDSSSTTSPDTGSLTPRPPPLKGVPECVERGDHVRARSRHRRHTVPFAHETIGAVSRLNDRHFAYSRPFQFALPVGVEEILVAARRAARECEEATSFIGLRGDRCRRLVTLEFEIHIARNARPFRYMLLDRGIPLHRSAAVLATPTLPIPNLPYPAPFPVGSHRAQSAIPVR